MTKARVLLCTSGGICATLSLQALLATDEIDVAGVFLSTRTRTKNGRFIGDALRIIRTSGLNYATYLAIGTTLFDCLRLRGVLPTVKKLASQHNIPFYCSKDINSSDSQSWLSGRAPDILLSSFFNLKLSPATIAIPSQAAINLHPALLPAYKGVDPVFYYFLNGEDTFGVSLHKITEEFDTGEVLAQSSMPKNPDKSVFWHNTELFRQGLELFRIWVKDPSSVTKIDNTGNSDQYDSWPSPSQVSALNHPLYNLSDFREQSRRPFK